MKLHIGNREFTSAASPVIIRATSGNLKAIYADYAAYELSSVIPRPALGVVKQLKPFYSLTEFHLMSNLNYMSGIFTGPVLQDMAQDSRIDVIWPDRVDKVMLQYPVSPPYPSASPDYTYSTYPGNTSKNLFFTSMQVIRSIVGAHAANQLGYTGNGMKAVVIDTGGTRLNPATPGITKETAIDHIYTDEIGHGEWCAAAIAGQHYQEQTYSKINKGKPPVVNQGIAPNASLTEIKALDFVTGTASDSILLNAIDMAIALKPDIISMSWGGTESYNTPADDPFYTAMQSVVNAGIIPVAAAGNSGPGARTIDSPGAMPQVLTIGAYNAVSNSKSMFGAAGSVAAFSSRGPTPWGAIKPDCVAPGAIINNAITGYLEFAYSHIPGLTQSIAGTSMATPIAAGLTLLMRQTHAKLLGKTLGVDEIKAMLQALGHTKNNTDGWGMLSWGMYQQWLSTQYGVTT
jgi:subtilisin family serine protease